MVDYQTLVGDTVDNVPGVTRSDPRRPAKWLAEHGTLDALIAAARKIKGAGRREPAHGARLAAAGPQPGDDAHRLRPRPGTSSAGPCSRACSRRATQQTAKLKRSTRRYGFKSLDEDIELENVTGRTPRRKQRQPKTGHARPRPDRRARERGVRRSVRNLAYDAVLTLGGARRRLSEVEVAELARSTPRPTRPTDPRQPVGLTLSRRPGEAAYLPLGPRLPRRARPAAARRRRSARLRPWPKPRDGEARPARQGDRHVFARLGIEVQEDATTPCRELRAGGAPAARPGEPGRAPPRPHRLTYEEVCGKGAAQIPFAQVAIERATEYSCEDSDMALHVHRALCRSSRPSPGWPTSTGESRCRPRESWRGSSAPAC